MKIEGRVSFLVHVLFSISGVFLKLGYVSRGFSIYNLGIKMYQLSPFRSFVQQYRHSSLI